MSVDFDEVKRKNPIEQVITESGIGLFGTGQYRKDAKDPSFVVNLKSQAFFQNGAGGDDEFGHDVISYVQHWKKCDVKQAVEFLCKRAGMPDPVWGDEAKSIAQRAQDDALTVAARLFVRWYRASDDAQAYAHGRGWNDETISKAGIGYTGNGSTAERKQLIEQFNAEGHSVDENAVKAVFAMPPKMLVYAHVLGGRVKYLSARHISEKRHYNLDRELVGDRQRFYNHEYSPSSELVAIVEGQADAVTLAQWGIASVALAGNYADEAFAADMKKHKYPVIALDFEASMWGKAQKLAEMVGPKTRLFKGMPA